MAKKKVRKHKSAVAQQNTRHSATLGVPQAAADAFMGLYNARQFEKARLAAKEMVKLYPDSAFAWKALGTACVEDNLAVEALPPLEQALALDPSDALTLTSLASTCFRLGDFQNAVEYQQQAVNIKPDYALGQYNLAEMLQSAGRLIEALDHAKKAKQLGFNEFRCLVLIGALQYQTKYFSDAFSVYKKLESDFPPHYAVYNNLGNLYKDVGDYHHAENYYQKSLALNPDYVTAYSNIFYAKHYNPAVKQTEIFEFATQWDKRFALERLPAADYVKKSAKLLRIGLISSSFRLHPVGQMITSALKESRSDILFYGYTTNDQADFITEKIRDACQVWRTIRHLSQRDIASQIRQDDIDILIDLSGHGDGSCLQAISMRPAPLCIKWVGGLVNTMGLESIDYLLSDSIETPEGVDDQYTEKLIRLPDDYICYVPCAYAPNTTSLPAIKNRYITLGCLNNPAKISSELLNEWATLMHQLADSRLLLRGPQYESQDFRCRIWDEMAAHGIVQERVLLEGPAKHKEFLETYQRIDIALDTWPYSGGLTTCEAMLMGVPVVTLPGPTFAGRHSATHLINAGLPELVTNSWDEYRQRVIELANDLPNLAVIRAGLRTILHYSPVCDAPRFANHFNNALRAIWVRYCEDKAPEALTFNKEGEMWFADEDKLVELPEALSEEENEDAAFEWKFDEPIIIVDNAAVLPRHPDYPKWMASGHLAVISFDPVSLLNNKIDELKEFGELHHYPHALLGDGQPATLYATLDAEKGSTLKPLPEDQLPKYQREKLKVLAELPVNTVALDSIEGLSSVDMLVLDDLHDAMKVFNNGEKYLKDTLLIQVKVAFQPTHMRQPNLAELQYWASRNGFRFYSFNSLCYREFQNKDVFSLSGSELSNADAVFIPNDYRIKNLSASKAFSLAYLLEEFYDFKDASNGVLELSVNTCVLNGKIANYRGIEERCEEIAKILYVNAVNNLTEAKVLVEKIRQFSKLDEKEIYSIVAQCERALSSNPSNNTAFFVLTHALLAKKTSSYKNKELLNNLDFHEWRFKYNLYQYWLDSVETIRSATSPKCSIIIIANKFKVDIIKNVKELRRQGDKNLEIVFVNNGACPNDFLALREYINSWIDMNGNSGAYLARNIGFVFSKAPFVLFVDDDGFPEEGFLSAHLNLHNKKDLVCLRGQYKSYSGNDPVHYSLGSEDRVAPPILEGNVSFSRNAFAKVGGWGDYILFGHGGFDISLRIFEAGYDKEKQGYTAKSILRHEYVRGSEHAKIKFKKQTESGLLLNALHGGLNEKLSQYFSAQKESLRKESELENHAKLVAPQSSFPPEVEELVINAYKNANVILEYGTGGSTLIAAKMKGKIIYGVENDHAWAVNVSQVLKEGDFLSCPLIHYVDIGKTGKWAKPINHDKRESYPSYASSIWNYDGFKEPDVVLIDGRLRTSCLLFVLMNAKKRTLVLFDDYKDRTYYHIVERLIKPVEIVGRMAVFDIDPSVIYIEPADRYWVDAEFYKVTLAGEDSR
ncbi:MAG: tetratricopeptide repeat protein [Halomonas sp.]|nr:tetratricopeptide repeat protein [Halomonas sp.]MBP5980046.1 tetratricopeptide repeat protein [Halomonas sp.]